METPCCIFLAKQQVLTHLIKDYIAMLFQEGMNVVALVFDGTFGNQSTAVHLGCELNPTSLKTWFQHPDNPTSRIYVIFDVCHMLKLMRNLLGDLKEMRTSQGGKAELIKWCYIEALNNIQENLGFTLANKLKKVHLMYEKNKMKVRFAAQTLSTSVAKAIDFLREETKLPEFQGSEATTRFIRKVDKVFDLLNSRHPFAKGNKAPVRSTNLHHWMDECKEVATYLFSLQDKYGNFIHETRRKTVVLGFAVSIHSLVAISQLLLTRNVDPLKYVLTYKFSQDHIELLFGKIRNMGGNNNNPSALDMKYALRKILVRNSIEPAKTGNCTNFEDALCESKGLFGFCSKRKQTETSAETDPEVDPSCEKMLIELDQESPNELLDNVLYYIAGYIVRALMKHLHCDLCKAALLLDVDNPHAVNMASYLLFAHFTCFKQCGGLLFPSPAVLKIVKASEVVFKRQVLWQGKAICFDQHISQRMQHIAFAAIRNEVFVEDKEHFFDHSIGVECDHLSTLAKSIIKKYLTLRLKTYSKRYSQMIAHKNQPSLRHSLTKAIIFRNQ